VSWAAMWWAWAVVAALVAYFSSSSADIQVGEEASGAHSAGNAGWFTP
jgi:hypothetical protein